MGQHTSLHCDTVCGEGVQEGTMALALLSAGFQSLPPLPTIKLGPSCADSQVCGFVYVLGPCGSLQWTPLWGWEFLLLPPQLPQVFSISGLRLYFPTLELWVVLSVTWSTSCCLSSQLQLCPPRSTIRHLAGSTSRRLASSPLCPPEPFLWLSSSAFLTFYFCDYIGSTLTIQDNLPIFRLSD